MENRGALCFLVGTLSRQPISGDKVLARGTRHVLNIDESEIETAYPTQIFSSLLAGALQHSFGTPQNRTLPQFNLHRARVHRNHGRPRPNGFTERAQNSPSLRTPSRNAPPVNL
jgi:hypothetical protein